MSPLLKVNDTREVIIIGPVSIFIQRKSYSMPNSEQDFHYEAEIRIKTEEERFRDENKGECIKGALKIADDIIKRAQQRIYEIVDYFEATDYRFD